MPCLYLKVLFVKPVYLFICQRSFFCPQDWHLVKSFPHSIAAYETPMYFSIDWLNEYWILGNQDDYRFVYIGPKGSW